MVIRNLENKSLEVSFEGWTYLFPKKKMVQVDEPVALFIQETWPLAFEIDVKIAKDEVVAKADKKKTPSLHNPSSPTTDMSVNRNGIQKGTFSTGEISEDGLDYGDGVEVETI